MRLSVQSGGHNGLRFFLDLREVFGSLKGFPVNLIHILGSGGTRGEPSVFRDNLEAADLGVIAGGAHQFVRDRLARQRVLGAQPPARDMLTVGLVVVAGMSIGTLFTLFVLPAVYVVLATDHRAKADSERTREIADYDLGGTKALKAT